MKSIIAEKLLYNSLITYLIILGLSLPSIILVASLLPEFTISFYPYFVVIGSLCLIFIMSFRMIWMIDAEDKKGIFKEKGIIRIRNKRV